MKFKYIALGVLALAAAPASAQTIVSGQVTQIDGPVNNYAAAPAYASTVFSENFEGTLSSKFTTAPAVVSGSVSGQYSNPTGDTSSKYAAVGPNIGGASYTPSLLNTTGLSFNQASIYWGSQDAFNVLSFLVGNNVVASFTGGAGQAGAESAYETYLLAPSLVGTITGINFASNGQNAFEFDNVVLGTSAVPEPASWALMIGGVGLVGGALRRRKQSNATGSLAIA